MIPATAVWPAARAGDALLALAEAASLHPRAEPLDGPPPGAALEAWLEDAASWIGVEAEPTAAAYPDVAAMVRGAVPALVVAAGGVLAVVGVGRRTLHVIGPDLVRARVPVGDVVDALRAPAEQTVAGELARIVARTAGARRSEPRLRAAVLGARLATVQVGGVVMLRRAIEAPLRAAARDLRLPRRLSAIAGLHLAGYAVMLASWWAIGHTILSGRIDPGWLSAWALLVATGTAARLAAIARAEPLAIDAATLLRQRLVVGALRVAPDLVRGDGAGRALGRVFEANALEQLAVTGGFTALFAAIELAVVGVVLALGAGGLLHVVLLAITVATAVLGSLRYLRARRAWTDDRLAITHDLVEVMLGHATRLAQEPGDDRHAREDRELARYARRSAELDRRLVWLVAAVPGGWLVIAALALAPAFVLGGIDVPALAIALGGMLLGYSALAKLGDAATRLADAAIAWRSVAPLLAAARIAPPSASPSLVHAPRSPGQPLVVARGVRYRPSRSSVPVLAGCDLIVREGDRVVLEGPSGAGKSTLAAILAGLRQPDAGLVLAGGLDRATLGERGWRRRVALVPQFHDNHLFLGSLAFNLLMARAWPPTRQDLGDADAISRELGLGPLIERMPSGLFQIVGETGWTLSHGERSRVFVARALLSGAPLTVLDESLAALDPQTLIDALACVERRARAAVVIAHP
ncbi:MAG: ATP-binding cassette domain-containing protein [Acidobacteriota bacterium]